MHSDERFCFVTPPPIGQHSIVVYIYVCPWAYLGNYASKLHYIFAPVTYGCVSLLQWWRCTSVVLWMTSRLHILDRNRRREKTHTQNIDDSTGNREQHGFDTGAFDPPGAAPDRGRSLIFACVCAVEAARSVGRCRTYKFTNRRRCYSGRWRGNARASQLQQLSRSAGRAAGRHGGVSCGHCTLAPPPPPPPHVHLPASCIHSLTLLAVPHVRLSAS